MSWGNRNWQPPRNVVHAMSQEVFMQQYILARAASKPGGIEVVYVVRDAAKAWRQLQHELGTSL